MRDRDIVAAIVAGDPAGLAAAYDSYAPGLYGYCRSLLGEPADAADAVQDTFVIAAAKVGGLRSASRLRPWLYAVARNECHGRLRARSRQADLDEAVDMTDEHADVGGAAQQGELRDLVIDAVAGLNQGDREVIELNLRHDLGGADLAGVLGVPVNQAHALASRARAQLERALGALLVARTGRRDCIELDDLLEGWDGRLTVLLRKRLSRHIDTCDICNARKGRVLSPAALLSLLPLVPLPAGLRQHVLRLVSDDSLEAAHYRGRVISRAGAFDQAGFPVQIAPGPPARRFRRRGGGGPLPGSGGGGPGGQRPALVLLAGAAALVLLCGGGVSVYVALSAGGGHARPPEARKKDVAGVPATTIGPASGGIQAPAAPATTPPGSQPPGTQAAPATTAPPRRTTSAPAPARSSSPAPDPSADPDPDPAPDSNPSLQLNPSTTPATSSSATTPDDAGQDGTLAGLGLELAVVVRVLLAP
jgi:RNA polymerase sigma factor (sigma-70 family)